MVLCNSCLYNTTDHATGLCATCRQHAKVAVECTDSPSDVLKRIEHAICIEGDYVPDYPDDTRHPVERRIAAMHDIITRLLRLQAERQLCAAKSFEDDE